VAIYDLFSKRQKRLRGQTPDVFQYDDIPDTLRVQILKIIQEVFDIVSEKTRRDYDSGIDIFSKTHAILCREYGRFRLWSEHEKNPRADFWMFFRECDDVENVLDAVEIGMTLVENANTIIQEVRYSGRAPVRFIEPKQHVDELNHRYKEHGVGYEYTSGQIIRVDSQYVHSEAVKPALALLAGKEYTNANDEFLAAHEHYRHGRYKECLNECLKAFESTMKIICH
jgi:hypothetical protein